MMNEAINSRLIAGRMGRVKIKYVHTLLVRATLSATHLTKDDHIFIGRHKEKNYDKIYGASKCYGILDVDYLTEG